MKRKWTLTRQERNNWVILVVLAIVGSLSIIPYSTVVLGQPTPTLKAIVLSLPNALLVYGLIVYVSLLLRRNLALAPLWSMENWKNSLIVALGMPIVLLALDRGFLFVTKQVLPLPQAPVAVRLGASLYGAFSEEILTRLFLMSLLWRLFARLDRFAPWTSIGLSSIAFAVLHLPAFKAYLLQHALSPSAALIGRTLVLNVLAGSVLGWVYWRRGLAQAFGVHFIFDLVLHVVWPMIGGSIS